MLQYANPLCSSSREKAVRELLARHVQDLDHNSESFLLDNLSIPKRYLTEAREIYAESDRDEDARDMEE